MGTVFFCGGAENDLKLDYSDGCSILIYEKCLNCTLKINHLDNMIYLDLAQLTFYGIEAHPDMERGPTEKFPCSC